MRLATLYRLLTNCIYDARRYLRHSGTLRQSDHEVHHARIMRDAHRLEKGLALPRPEPGYGSAVVKRLVPLLASYRSRFEQSGITDLASAAIKEHAEFNGIDPLTDRNLSHTVSQARSYELGGTQTVLRADVHAHAKRDLSGFFANRHSVRVFDSTPVDQDTIRAAVTMALKTPSVCNRQSWRVHVPTGEETKKRALFFQNGNRGFGHLAPVVRIVTSDLRSFLEPFERYQCWIDGGLFAISLNYAFHSLGLGACMLNWSVDASVDTALRQEIGIPAHEAIITFMAIGHLPEKFKVARSCRREIEDVLTFHEG
jgi:nitroreductase